MTYHILSDHQQRHEAQGAILSQRIIVDLGHGLPKWGRQKVFEILCHTCRYNNTADPTEQPTRTNGEQNSKWHRFRGIGSFFRDVDWGKDGQKFTIHIL